MIHDVINQYPSALSQREIPIGIVKTASAAKMPEAIVNEVINSGVNVSGKVDNDCTARPSLVSRLICESYYQQEGSQPPTFITQE